MEVLCQNYNSVRVCVEYMLKKGCQYVFLNENGHAFLVIIPCYTNFSGHVLVKELGRQFLSKRKMNGACFISSI